MKEVLDRSAKEKSTRWRELVHKNRKNILSAAFFLILAVLTFYAVFHGNDMNAVIQSIRKMRIEYMILAAVAAIFFVSAEGIMIWYLMHALDPETRLLQCIRYSFIGFFFSGITPSATGGQPVQLYYMNKDGRKLSESTVVLMIVAIAYKFVLVLMGIGILIFYHSKLVAYLGDYLYLYKFGLTLNIILVVFLLFVMFRPTIFLKVITVVDKGCVRLHILKQSDARIEKIRGFVSGYHEAVLYLSKNQLRILAVILFTAVQRISIFVLTYLVYRGFSLSGTSAMTVILVQASVYIAVDMLPLPGAQGITELMYKSVFSQIFTGNFLTASMCVTRGLNFYFLLIISAAVTLSCYIINRLDK